VQRIVSTKDKVPENCSLSCGRRKKVTLEQEALILRSIPELREEEGSFSSRLMECTGLCLVTDRTIRRLLNRNGYFFLQACIKVLMTRPNKDQRVEFAQKIQAQYSPSVWTDSITFYLDGVSFVYKTNPLDQARAPKGRVWGKRSDTRVPGKK